jgi:asparagine synthase (glutamine-hydrolysing)
VCGIAGVVGAEAQGAEDSVAGQLRCLDHRGPDASGVYARGAGAIGQNRLAVIDLDTGAPPITNEDGTLGVVLNGEIYNYGELRDELRGRGHRLATRGDTEVIVHLAEELDPRSLARQLEGMFAFAVWDSRRERLILGRDRLGKKPLYYWEGGGALVFGSEIKAVLADPRVPRRLDRDAIPAYLAFGYVPTPRTFFEGVCSVPPGHTLVKDGHGLVRVEPYWEPAVPSPGGVARLELSLDEAAGEVRRLVRAAVARRMAADVPIGAFLSGGIDSSTVVGVMAELSPAPVRTFTIGFADSEGFDERPYARLAAERFGTDHVEHVVQPDAVDLIERLVWHHDQPFGDSSAIPTFILSELTRSQVTVALCGDGGDELFAGYKRFTAALVADRWGGLLPAAAGALAERATAHLPGRVRATASLGQRFLARAGERLPDAYLDWASFVGPEWRASLTGSSESWATDAYRRQWAATAGSETIDRLLDINLRTYLLDDLLPKVDRAAMAHALEVRSPLLDRELAEFALRLPRAARVRGMSRKRVLRRAVQDLVPGRIRRRRKRGFGVPLDRWFRTDLRSYVERTLGASDARVRAHLAPAAVDSMIAEHLQDRANHGHALWTLLTLEVFLRREDW